MHHTTGGKPDATPTQDKRFFSIELNSITNIKNLQIDNGEGKGSMLIEGTIGNLLQADFAEGIVLEVVGDKGALRINLLQEEIKKHAPPLL